MDSAREVKFGWGKSVLFGFIICSIFLTTIEAGLRVWAYYFREEYERYDRISETFVLVPGEHRRGSLIIKINSDGFIGEELQPDGQNLTRIVSLGDSCTFGAGDYETAYPVLLDKLLQQDVLDDGRLEVINAGVEGHNSSMALRRFQHKVAPLVPDLVIVYIGWNDLMKGDPYGQADSGAMSTVVRALDKLWLTRGTRKFVFFHVRPHMDPPLTGTDSFRDSFAEFVPTIYEINLTAILRSIIDNGATPVLVTLPTVVRADMSAEDLQNAGVFFPYFPSAYAVGDFLQLVESYNSVIRSTAASMQVELVDLADSFAGLEPSKDYFYDTMHLNKRGREIAAQLIAKHLRERNLLPKFDADG